MTLPAPPARSAHVAQPAFKPFEARGDRARHGAQGDDLGMRVAQRRTGRAARILEDRDERVAVGIAGSLRDRDTRRRMRSISASVEPAPVGDVRAHLDDDFVAAVRLHDGRVDVRDHPAGPIWPGIGGLQGAGEMLVARAERTDDARGLIVAGAASCDWGHTATRSRAARSARIRPSAVIPPRPQAALPRRPSRRPIRGVAEQNDLGEFARRKRTLFGSAAEFKRDVARLILLIAQERPHAAGVLEHDRADVDRRGRRFVADVDAGIENAVRLVGGRKRAGRRRSAARPRR